LLAYSVTGDTTRDDIWLLPLEGDRQPKVFKQTPFSENDGMISPDGRWMMYVSSSSGQAEVYLEPMPSGGAVRQISVGGGLAPAWRADGRELYYLAGTKLMAVDVKPGTELMFGTPHELFTEPKIATGLRIISVYPSKDGSRFLVLRSVGEAGAPPLTVVTNWQAAYGSATKR
jgi:eukaryotic-like serine/threonine-protein kinase